MPLSRREIRTRATKFAKQWVAAHNEEAEAKPFWVGVSSTSSVSAPPP
ncbi:MAG: hypothetical protein IPI07_19415 [Flavobacteriales bacterium]|nr:hypothetical protein [Flavobacteriales bacterium]